MQNSQRKTGVILSYVLIFINILMAICYTPFMTRIMGQSEYGLYSLVSSIIGYLTILDFGFGNAIIVYTSKYKKKNDLSSLNKLYGMFLVIYCIIACIAFVLGICLYLCSDLLFSDSMTIAELEKVKIMFLVLSFNLVLTFIFTIYSSLITANEKFTFQKVIALIRTILNPIVMIPLLLMGYRSITMVIVVTILNVLVLLCNYIYCRKRLNIKIKFSGFDKKILKEICAYSVFIFLNIIIDKANWSLDQFILGSVSGTVAVSVYSVASQFNTLYLSFSTAISGVLLPKISNMIENNASDADISNEFIKTSRIQYYVLFLIVTGFVIFGKDVIILLFGNSYINSYYVALLLMIPATIPLTQNVGISILQAKNLHKFRSIILFFIALINISLTVPLAKYYGSVGAAIGTAIALMIGNIIIINLYYYFKAKIDIKSYWHSLFIMTIKMCLPLLFVIIMIKFLSFGCVINLLVYIPLYVLLYSLCCYYLVMNNYEKGLINGLFGRVLKVLNRKK